MEIITEEPLKILSQLFIPLILVATSGIIPALISHYSKSQDKNEYIRFLRTNNSVIRSYLFSLETYKTFGLGIAPFSFIFGIVVGVLFEYVINPLLLNIFLWVLEIDYIEKKIPIIHDLTLNGILFILSCLHILILITFVIWLFWYIFLRSKNLAAPKLTESKNIKPSSLLVFASYWVFLGAIFGVDFGLYIITLASFLKYSIITNDFAFNWITFAGICESLKNSVLYYNFYVFVYFAGAYISLLYLLVVYYSIYSFSSEVKRLIVNSYLPDFPEVKITTEYGEVKGKLGDILNKRQVTLSENCTVKTILWNKIEMMEINKEIE